MKTLTPNEEIRELGNMLFATDAGDARRLLSICKRVGEIAAANPGTVTDEEGRVYLEGDCLVCTDLEHCGSEFCKDPRHQSPENCQSPETEFGENP